MSSPVVETLIKIVYKGLEHFGRYYSEYQGFCVNNQDPQGMGRIQIQVPGIIDNATDEWYYGSGNFSGIGYGCQVLPQKGDVVMVWFEMGDPNKPRWRLGYFGEDEIPKELKSPNIYWFKTPKGLLVELDDDKGEIRMTDSNGNKMTSSKAGISLDSPRIFMAGTEKGSNSSALGNQTENVLTAHNEGITNALSGIKTLNSQVTSLMNTMAAASSPVVLVASVAAQVPTLVKKISDANAVNEIANKSISDISKKIPQVKSSKISINE